MKDDLNISGIGIDLVEVDRIKRLINKYPKFLNKFFTKNEIEYCNGKKNRAIHFAGKFAAKEAIIKSIGFGNNAIKLKEIEINNMSNTNNNSIPKVILHGSAISLANKRDIEEILISITHTKEYAIAIAYTRGKA
ncbi:unnamed protein product [marine sediment metagenome]|uniref:4'-phosphopantetheinyl transferase domain-containing protein n=1 Tax=marine sediment metagenome TaxID=412755 RepID=X0ZCB5_9ZZZZ